MYDYVLSPWAWYGVAVVLVLIEALRPGKFALWLGLCAILVGIVVSVAPWPWPQELVVFVVFAFVAIAPWRRYERRT